MSSVEDRINSHMENTLSAQKQAFLQNVIPDARSRIDKLNIAIELLVDNRKELEAAVSEDFGHRSDEATAFSDIMPAVGALKFARDNVRNWMKAEKRRSVFPLGLLGANSKVEFQPKGVVGLMTPWNFPIGMVFTPLAGILGAGNRVMIKPSEFTPKTSELTAKLLSQAFSVDEVAVFQGGPEVGAAFSKLPFDHLMFTGATSVGRHVMRAAAENLTPVTLELGGKSPVVIGKSASLDLVAKRVMAGKVLNAGQICLAPDYVLVPEGKQDELIQEIKKAVSAMHPSGLLNNDDYTSVINERHYSRLNGYIEDAEKKGATVISLAPENEDFSQQPHRKIAPTLLINVSDDMQVMQDEIFGPILPIKTYSDIESVVGYINERDRPLALYYFGSDQREERSILENTVSGGVTVNDVIFHNGQQDLPFGGTGASGIGCYHGRDGFLEFSHKKAVFHQMKIDALQMLRPPYGKLFHSEVNRKIKR